MPDAGCRSGGEIMDFVTKVLVILFGYVTLFYGVRGFHNDPKCGQNFYRNSKIIGGEEVKEAEFPWYVSIKETGQHECGGFIINQKAVLTAAHYFKDFSDRAASSPKTISVTLAVNYLNRRRLKRVGRRPSLKSKWEQDVKVKQIIRHPYYDAFSDSGKFDIAILLLEDEVQWNYGTQPVCLPTPTSLEMEKNQTAGQNNMNVQKHYPNRSGNFTPNSEQDFRSGETAVVAGWASIAEIADESILHKVRLTLYNNQDCMQMLREKNVTLKTDIDSSVICAGSIEMGYDSCSGDSGSALLIQRGKKWVAIGIVSSGFGKCGSGRPGLYTRISSYLEWIDLHNSDKIDSTDLFHRLSSLVPA